MPRAIEDPILAYTSAGEINQIQWSSTQPDWIAICYNNCLEILRVWTKWRQFMLFICHRPYWKSFYVHTYAHVIWKLEQWLREVEGWCPLIHCLLILLSYMYSTMMIISYSLRKNHQTNWIGSNRAMIISAVGLPHKICEE